jgi:hypothetical protein
VKVEREESGLSRLPDASTFQRGIGTAGQACLAGYIGRPAAQKPVDGCVRNLGRNISTGDVHRRHAMGEGPTSSEDVQRLLNLQH